MKPQEVTTVATLGKLLATLARRDMMPHKSQEYLYLKPMDFNRKLWATMDATDDTWWQHYVTSDDKAPPASLSRPELRNTCTEVATARARELQAEAACYGSAQEHSVELGQTLGREEGPEVVAGREAQVKREAWVASSEARRATMERQRAETALGQLQSLGAACDEAAAFPRELQCRVRDIEATPKGTKEVPLDVPEYLRAVAEQLMEASTCPARGHLLGAVDDVIIRFHSEGGGASPGACGVAERCQRASEDIPDLQGWRCLLCELLWAVTFTEIRVASPVICLLTVKDLRRIWGIFWRFSLKLSQILMAIPRVMSLPETGVNESPQKLPAFH